MEKNIILSYLRYQILKKGIGLEEAKRLCRVNNVSFKSFINYLSERARDNSTQEEKEAYNLFVQKISMEKRKLSKINPILLRFGIESMYLYENEEQKMQMGKFIFEYCIEKGKINGCKELSIIYGLKNKDLDELYDHYQIKSGIDYDYSYLRYHKPTVTSPTKVDVVLNKIIELLKKEENDLNKYKENNYSLNEALKNEIRKVIEESGLCPSVLKDRILGYITKYQLDNQYYDLLINVISHFNKGKGKKVTEKNRSEKFNLTSKLITYYAESDLSIGDFCEKMNISVNKFFESVEGIKEEDLNYYNHIQTIILSHETVLSFIVSDYNIFEFREKMNISSNNMNRLLNCVKSDNEELYNKYIEHVKKTDELTLSKLEVLAKYLKEGINVNGINRPFSVIDYYIIMDFNFKHLKTYARMLTNIDDRNAILIFCKKYEKYLYNINVIQFSMAKAEFSFRNLNSSNGNTLITLTYEQKISIIEYLKSNNIPLNEFTIYEAFRLFVGGSLLGYTETQDKEISTNKSIKK